MQINQININSDGKSESNIKFIERNIKISNVDEKKYSNGLNVFGLFQGREGILFKQNSTYLAITDMEGKFVVEPLVYIPPNNKNTTSFSQIQWINETTVLTNYENQPYFWNVANNRTVRFSFARDQHHDIKYNPTTKTFMVLEYYLDEVKNSTGQLEDMILDRISEYDLKGNVVWEWLIKDYINFTQYYENLKILNSSIAMANYKGKLYPSPTDANSLYWDMDEGMLYLNVRHLNQFIAINYITRTVEYIAGQNGNFTLIDSSGNERDSLWYHSNDLKPIGNNEFIMFDNNFHNITDPELNHTRSSLLRVIIDSVNKTITEVFRWQAPSNDFGYFWGGVNLLENGNYLGSFGSLIHGPQQAPFHTQYGGTAVEITPNGEEVWRMKVPYNWGFNQIDRIYPVIRVDGIPQKVVEVGTKVKLEWSSAFSNFPKSYSIEIDSIEVENNEWNNQLITYTIDTTDFSEGEHFVTLTLVDQAGNEKKVANEIDILLPQTSSSKDTIGMSSFVTFSSLLVVILLINKPRKIKY